MDEPLKIRLISCFRSPSSSFSQVLSVGIVTLESMSTVWALAMGKVVSGHRLSGFRFSSFLYLTVIRHILILLLRVSIAYPNRSCNHKIKRVSPFDLKRNFDFIILRNKAEDDSFGQIIGNIVGDIFDVIKNANSFFIFSCHYGNHSL